MVCVCARTCVCTSLILKHIGNFKQNSPLRLVLCGILAPGSRVGQRDGGGFRPGEIPPLQAGGHAFDACSAETACAVSYEFSESHGMETTAVIKKCLCTWSAL